MPKSPPAKVDISPKAIKTLVSIIPAGGMITPVNSRITPERLSSNAVLKCANWFICWMLCIKRELRNICSNTYFFNSLLMFCKPFFELLAE